MNDREFETILKSPQTNAFDPSSLSGSSLEHNQTIFGDPLSHEPLGMPSFEDAFEAIWQERGQGAEGSELEDDGSAEDASTSGFLAPTNFSVDQVVAHFPSLDSALETGSALWDRGTSAFEQVVESGSLLVKDKFEALSDTVQSKLEVAWDDWNASDNSLHNALDQKIEATVEDVNEWANDVGRSEFWARVKQRYNQTIDSISGLTEGITEALGYGTSASDISKEEAAVESAMSRLADNLMDLTQDPDFETTIKTAFGEADITKAEELIEGIAEGKGGPEIEVIDGEKLEGLGAFGDGRIFISDETVAESADNPEVLNRVLLEEVGHYIDQALNDVDSPGDEGEIFAGLAQKETFSVQELQDLKNENDSSILKTDGKTVTVENLSIIDPQLISDAVAQNNLLQYEPGQPLKFDPRVADWQQGLKDLGYSIEVDGLFGSDTAAITRLYQQEQGLAIDGIVGPDTLNSLDSAKRHTPVMGSDRRLYNLSGNVETFDSAYQAQQEALNPTPLLQYEPGQALAYNNRVADWQQSLKDLGYSIEVDGLFGSDTAAITRLYQQEQGLAIDGIVGPDTLNSLDSAEPHILGSDRHLHNLANSIEQTSTENKGQLTSRRATPDDYPNGELTNEGVADILGALEDNNTQTSLPATQSKKNIDENRLSSVGATIQLPPELFGEIISFGSGAIEYGKNQAKDLFENFEGGAYRYLGYLKDLPDRISRFIVDDIELQVATIALVDELARATSNVVQAESIQDLEDAWTQLSESDDPEEFLRKLGDLTVSTFDIVGGPEIWNTISDFTNAATRPLTNDERETAKSVYGDSIDYDVVHVEEKALAIPLSRMFTGRSDFDFVTFNTINSWGTSSEAVFIHELAHIWQFQDFGSHYIHDAIVGQAEGYDYGSLQDLEAADTIFEFNLEQQADIIADYYRIRSDLSPKYGEGTNLSKKDKLEVYAKFVSQVSTLTEDMLVS